MNENLTAVLLGAISAGVFSAVGWFVSYFLSKRREYNLQKRKSIIGQLERQIEELYGPLLGLIRNSRYVFEVSKKLLPSDQEKGILFENFTEQDYKIYWHFTDNYFLPNNAKIANLLHTKLSLLETERMPKSFDDFLKHQAEYECTCRATRLIDSHHNGFVDYDQEWPKQFEEDVEKLLRATRESYDDYLKKLRES